MSASVVDCMKAPGPDGDVDPLTHSSLKLQLKEEDEQTEREYHGPMPEQQPAWEDAGIVAEIHLYKGEEEEKSSIWVETKTEELAGTDGTLLVLQENGGGTEGGTWLIQCPEVTEPLKTALLGAGSVVQQEEVGATSQQSQEDETLSDRMETSQQDSGEAEDVETPETESEGR